MSENQEDFGVHGEGCDDSCAKEVKGITDKVTEFSYTNLDYPCVILKEDFHCQKHQIKVVSNMVRSKCGLKDINLYFSKGNELFKMGNISGLQIGYLLDMLGTKFLSGYMDANTKLDDDRLYALGTLA